MTSPRREIYRDDPVVAPGFRLRDTRSHEAPPSAPAIVARAPPPAGCNGLRPACLICLISSARSATQKKIITGKWKVGGQISRIGGTRFRSMATRSWL